MSLAPAGGQGRVRAIVRSARAVIGLLALVGLLSLRTVTSAQGPAPAPVKPEGPKSGATPHPSGELDCRNCHVGKHQGVARMYLGTGGRGAPMIPSHMLQVRVECIACHIAPKEEEEGRAGAVGQTFKPTEQACVNCHGEKYRGMLPRWVATLAKMQEVVAPKLAGARDAVTSADPKHPRLARALRLVDDAEFNIRFVSLGKGVHNVFYTADLLKLSNGWLDEALRLLGKAPARADDALVRGGYCAVLCHEQAGVKLKETVTFAQQKIPHGRHVAELGAVCTACHSAETHKTVTATAATCSACHHSPQNDRCESCHRAQSAFYRGTVEGAPATIEPNVMVDPVPCTGCHDFARKHSRQAVGQKCVGCHEPPYLALLEEWTAGFDKDAAQASAALRRAETVLDRARRAGQKTADADLLVKDARSALALVRQARGVHNPGAADALLELARQKAEEALALAGRR